MPWELLNSIQMQRWHLIPRFLCCSCFIRNLNQETLQGIRRVDLCSVCSPLKNSPASETMSKSKGYFGIVPVYFGGVCEVAELQVCGHTTVRGRSTRVL